MVATQQKKRKEKNKYVDVKFSAYDTFLYILSKPKVLNRTANMG